MGIYLCDDDQSLSSGLRSRSYFANALQIMRFRLSEEKEKARVLTRRLKTRG